MESRPNRGRSLEPLLYKLLLLHRVSGAISRPFRFFIAADKYLSSSW